MDLGGGWEMDLGGGWEIGLGPFDRDRGEVVGSDGRSTDTKMKLWVVRSRGRLVDHRQKHRKATSSYFWSLRAECEKFQALHLLPSFPIGERELQGQRLIQSNRRVQLKTEIRMESAPREIDIPSGGAGRPRDQGRLHHQERSRDRTTDQKPLLIIIGIHFQNKILIPMTFRSLEDPYYQIEVLSRSYGRVALNGLSESTMRGRVIDRFFGRIPKRHHYHHRQPFGLHLHNRDSVGEELGLWIALEKQRKTRSYEATKSPSVRETVNLYPTPKASVGWFHAKEMRIISTTYTLQQRYMYSTGMAKIVLEGLPTRVIVGQSYRLTLSLVPCRSCPCPTATFDLVLCNSKKDVIEENLSVAHRCIPSLLLPCL
jgi:hypothetical protein